MIEEHYWMICPGCKELYDRAQGTGKHTDCENALAAGKRTPEERMRRAWDRRARYIRPIIFERDGAVCKKCGTTENLVIDHITPISWGGTNYPENLQILCEHCNSVKGDRI